MATDLFSAADRVLAIDASTESCSVALQTFSNTYLRSSNEARAHAQALLPMIDEVLEEAGLELSELDYLAVVNGPGSFTGIRIAISVLQGLAYGAGLRVFCASSMEVMVSHCLRENDLRENSSHGDHLIIPALDARMGEVYWAAYKLAAEGGLLEFHAPRVMAVDDFLSDVKHMSKENSVTYAGSVFDVKAFNIEKVAEFSSHRVDFSCVPSAAALLYSLSLFPKKALAIHELEPLYLRNEVAWKKRTRIRREAIT